MKEIDWIKSLARDRDRDVDAAELDVAASVMRHIRSRQAQSADDPLALPALFATLAGGVAVIVAFQLIVTDPFAGFLDAFNLVLQ